MNDLSDIDVHNLDINTPSILKKRNFSNLLKSSSANQAELFEISKVTCASTSNEYNYSKQIDIIDTKTLLTNEIGIDLEAKTDVNNKELKDIHEKSEDLDLENIDLDHNFANIINSNALLDNTDDTLLLPSWVLTNIQKYKFKRANNYGANPEMLNSENSCNLFLAHIDGQDDIKSAIIFTMQNKLMEFINNKSFGEPIFQSLYSILKNSANKGKITEHEKVFISQEIRLLRFQIESGLMEFDDNYTETNADTQTIKVNSNWITSIAKCDNPIELNRHKILILIKCLNALTRLITPAFLQRINNIAPVFSCSLKFAGINKTSLKYGPVIRDCGFIVEEILLGGRIFHEKLDFQFHIKYLTIIKSIYHNFKLFRIDDKFLNVPKTNFASFRPELHMLYEIKSFCTTIDSKDEFDLVKDRPFKKLSTRLCRPFQDLRKNI